MATDYEAVYESVMKYTRMSARDVDSQEKLARYLRQNDRGNKMTDKLIDRLVETSAAQRDIDAAKENNFDNVRQARIQNADTNADKERERRRAVYKSGKTPKGTVTAKRNGERYVIYTNSQGKLVYYDEKLNRAREVKVDKNNNYVIGGRFAKRY